MNDDRLPSIGGFALLTGLSVTILRHYDAEGVLPPAVVDPGTGYRRYRPEQAALARQADRYLVEGVDMPTVNQTRIVQATIAATDRAALIAFYAAAFGARFNTEIGSFEFGARPDDEFFLLTLADDETHPAAPGPARFGLSVPDVDAAHRCALKAGLAR